MKFNMSSEQMSHFYPQHRSHRVPTAHPHQSQNSCLSYGSPAGNVPETYMLDRQSGLDPRYSYGSTNLVPLARMSNHALVDSLIALNQGDHEHRRAVHAMVDQQHRQPYPLSHPSRSDVIQANTYESDYTSEGAVVNSREPCDKNPAKKRKRKSSVAVESDDEYVEYNGYSSPRPSRRTRRSSRPKRIENTVERLTPDEDSVSPRKREKSKKIAAVAKPKKQRPVRTIRKKPVGTSVPKTLAEAGPADRMMWTWKNQGKNWEEIRAEWKRLTGIAPGGSSLSVRYIKLVENLARNGAAGDIELLRFRKEAEGELLSHLWEKVAEKMLAFNPGSEHNPKDLKKRYDMLLRSDFDVEKALAEDDTNRQARLGERSGDERNCRYDTDDHTEAGDTAADYDDPTARQVATSLRQQDQAMQSPYGSSIANSENVEATVMHQENVFEPICVLQQEIDVLCEQSQLRDIKYDGPNDEPAEHFSPATPPLQTSQFAHRQLPKQPTLGKSPSMESSLVNYDTDSD